MGEINGMDAMDAAKEYQIRDQEDRLQRSAQETSDYYDRRCSHE